MILFNKPQTRTIGLDWIRLIRKRNLDPGPENLNLTDMDKFGLNGK